MLKYCFIILIVGIITCIAYQTCKNQIVNYHESGIYTLTESNSTLNVPDNFRLLLGKDSLEERVYSGDYKSQPEATVLSIIPLVTMQYEQVVTYEYIASGHLDTNNMNIDSKEILTKITNRTKENHRHLSRSSRRKNVTIMGWIKEPTYDVNTNTLMCVLEASSGVNCIALRPTRMGCEKIVGIFTKRYYTENPHVFEDFLTRLEISSGNRYEDFSNGYKQTAQTPIEILENHIGMGSNNFQDIFRIVLPPFFWLLYGGFLIYYFSNFWNFCLESSERKISESIL